MAQTHKLASVRVQNLRSYEDSGEIVLGDLNIFIGPNNAGKSTLVSVIRLLLEAQAGLRPGEPLPLVNQPEYASFDSVVRHHWAPKKPNPTEFVIEARWTGHDSKHIRDFWSRYTCRPRGLDGSTFVAIAEYGRVGKQDAVIRLEATDDKPGHITYRLATEEVTPKGGSARDDSPVFFMGIRPEIITHRKPSDTLRAFLREIGETAPISRVAAVAVTQPHRPVPRSLYVIDDPRMDEEDRGLLSQLLSLWSSEKKSAVEARARIVGNLQTLRLAKSFSVVQKSKKGPRVAEIRVGTDTQTRTVTIADVGFGLSQILPLLAKESTLSGGNLLVYQPEVHLHPFAQSRLADLFVSSTARGNSVFVETHSPDLVLRLQALIAEGDIESHRAAVFCVERTSNFSAVRRMSFGEDGAPTEPWPKGFLDTSLTLAREIAQARLETAKKASAKKTESK